MGLSAFNIKYVFSHVRVLQSSSGTGGSHAAWSVASFFRSGSFLSRTATPPRARGSPPLDRIFLFFLCPRPSLSCTHISIVKSPTMPTLQLPTSLPSGWESEYDATSERWFFVHRPTGYSQFFFPKAGDENTRVAQLAQPQPTNASLVMKMDAMAISETTNTQQSNGQAGTPIQTTIIPQPGPMQAIQPNTHNTPPVQAVSTPQPSQHVQKSPTQRSPLARTGTIQRKAIPRSGSVQSQASTTSSQLSAQPNQQHQVSNPQIQQSSPQYVQNVQNSAQGTDVMHGVIILEKNG